MAQIAIALRQELGRLSTDMHAIINAAKADGDRYNKSGLTSDELTRWTKMRDDFTRIEDSVAAEERTVDITAKLARPLSPGAAAGGGQPAVIDEMTIEQLREEFSLKPAAIREREKLFASNSHARAFHNYLTQPLHAEGSDGLNMEDRKLLNRFVVQNAQSSVGGQGGYLIPQGFSENLFEAMKWWGGIENVVGEFSTSTGNTVPWPTINDTANKGRILGQNNPAAETDFVFGQVQFNAYIGSSDLVLIPIALIEDSYFDMEALTARLLGTRLGRLLNWKCTVGSGSNEPTGIVNASVTAGNILTLGTGNTTGFAYSNLVDLEGDVDPAYRYNPAARWMLPDASLKVLKKMVDGQSRPLWQPGISASFREGAAVDLVASKPTILDHPYVINQDMASPAANAYSMLYGDMSCFKLRRVAGGITVMRLVERYAEYLQVAFQAFMRFDSNLIDAGTHPVAVLQQSAA